MSSNVDLNVRPGFDGLISEIANYVSNYEIKSDLALDTARNCLIDTIVWQVIFYIFFMEKHLQICIEK